MITEYYGDLKVDWDDGEHDRLVEMRKEREASIGDTYRASLYFNELKRLRELANVPINE